jgi:hypothetical protein
MDNATASTAAPDRVVGEARTYDELIKLFRMRCDELGVAMERLDDVSGLPSRYISKLLAPVPVKGVGRVSLGPLCGTLALKLIVAIDQEQYERIKARLKPGASPASRRKHRHPNSRKQLRGNSEWGRIMRARATVLLSPQQRRHIAKQAARARWAKT